MMARVIMQPCCPAAPTYERPLVDEAELGEHDRASRRGQLQTNGRSEDRVGDLPDDASCFSGW